MVWCVSVQVAAAALVLGAVAVVARRRSRGKVPGLATVAVQPAQVRSSANERCLGQDARGEHGDGPGPGPGRHGSQQDARGGAGGTEYDVGNAAAPYTTSFETNV